MLIILTETQVLKPEYVCHDCMLASQDGQPRWHNGRPCASERLPVPAESATEQYQCPMGFRLVYMTGP